MDCGVFVCSVCGRVFFFFPCLFLWCAQPALFDPTMKKKKKKKPKPTALDDGADAGDGVAPAVNGSAGNDLPADDALPVGGAAAGAPTYEIDESEFAPMDLGKKKKKRKVVFFDDGDDGGAVAGRTGTTRTRSWWRGRLSSCTGRTRRWRRGAGGSGLRCGRRRLRGRGRRRRCL